MLSKQHKTHSGLLLIKVNVCPPHTVPAICSPRTMYAHHTQCHLSVHQGQCMPTTHSAIYLFTKDNVCPPHTVPSICSPRTMYARHTIPVAILSRCTGLGPKEFTSELRSAWILKGQPCGARKGQHLLTFSSFSWL